MIQRQFVGGLEAAAGGQAVRNAREVYGKRLQQLDQVIGRGLAFDIGGQRQNDFGKAFGLYARHQRIDPQVFRAHVIERRNPAA